MFENLWTTTGTTVILSLMSILIGEMISTWVEYHIKMIDEENLRRRDTRGPSGKVELCRITIGTWSVGLWKDIVLFNHNTKWRR